MTTEGTGTLRELYAACGPMLRYRIVRDVIGHDESYIETANMALDVRKLPDVQQVLAAQQPNGSWGDFRTTKVAAHRLCEFGQETSREIELLREQVLLPTLVKEDVLWEFMLLPLDEAGKKHARRIVRDKALHLLCRSSKDEDPVTRTYLEVLLAEWELYLTEASRAKEAAHLPVPTADGYAAVCRYPWNDDEFPRVHDLVQRIATHTAEHPPPAAILKPLAASLFRLHDKWQYLAQPPRLLYELELAATLGIARDLEHSAWMLEELEARQDADGFFRFPDAGKIVSSWYFPLEKDDPDEFYVEYTFRAELIFSLLAYDI